MIVIGVDPGYHRIGFAVVEINGNNFKLLFSECHTIEKELQFPERITIAVERFIELCEKHKPEVCGIEEVFMNKNQKTAMKVAEVRGALVYASHRQQLHVKQYTPIEIKKALTGHGNADKKQVEKMIKTIIKDVPEGRIDDEYDAIAVATAVVLVD